MPPATTSPSPDDAAAAIVLDVVADLSPASGSVPASNTYLDGMRLANEEVNAAGGVTGRPLELVFHDSGGEITRARQALQDALVRGATALIYAGSGSVVSELRPQLATTGT
ncbi:MAG: ABC transporter substrate-binding protein, partial [Actinobacteria bacterium]|nr:ABC transporter substrate-binding protein [Actinomycetota bacterium]